MTAVDLSQYVGANAEDSAFVASCWARADALISQHVGVVEVPSAILIGAILEVGSELFHRRNSPSGIAQFATAGDASPVRLARDPLTSVYSVLAPWLGVGVA
jgi:hypothetical protein